MNIGRHNMVIAYIEVNPGKWVQHYFEHRGTRCYLGISLLLSGAKMGGIETAKAWLGLTSQQATSLMYARNTLDDLKRLGRLFGGEL